MKTLIFFNNKGGVGKTTLVYHVAYMLSELGYKTLLVDLDPQSNLTSICLSQDKLEKIYDTTGSRATILSGVSRLNRGLGDIEPVEVHPVSRNIGLLAGDLELSLFEDKLSENWGKTLNQDEAAFRVTSAFYRIIQAAGIEFGADYCLVDVGPNLGAINRATLIAGDYYAVPMASDLFSLQGLRNIGERLDIWKSGWQKRRGENPDPQGLKLPLGEVKPLGYILMQHGVRDSRPVRAYLDWANRIPAVFREAVLKQPPAGGNSVENDPNCLALLKHYHSLVPMAMEARKPIFLLKPADGAIGAHTHAVKRAYEDFKTLTKRLLKLMN